MPAQIQTELNKFNSRLAMPEILWRRNKKKNPHSNRGKGVSKTERGKRIRETVSDDLFVNCGRRQRVLKSLGAYNMSKCRGIRKG